MVPNEISYHRWRASCEREAAEACRDEMARASHRSLAELHLSRVAALEVDQDQRIARVR